MFMRTTSNDSQVTVNLGQARKKGTPEQGTYEILLEVGWPGHLPSKFWFDAESQDIGHNAKRYVPVEGEIARTYRPLRQEV